MEIVVTITEFNRKLTAKGYAAAIIRSYWETLNFARQKRQGEKMTFTEAVKELDLKHPISQMSVTPLELINILQEDVVYAVTRPGSWEGSNMLTVLICHGFFTHRHLTDR